jgi:CRP-like cAMP-binding protein
MKLPGLERKIRVPVGWTLDLLLPSDIVQLRRSVHEHFEPGQAIFREGDHGDWLYLIEDGLRDFFNRLVEERVGMAPGATVAPWSWWSSLSEESGRGGG